MSAWTRTANSSRCACSRSAPDSGQKSVTQREAEFTTDWRSWSKPATGPATACPNLRPTKLRYCIESTGTYHLPVLQAWGGIPCVVNPLLAGPTRRKTDVLDARLLAHHSITGRLEAELHSLRSRPSAARALGRSGARRPGARRAARTGSTTSCSASATRLARTARCVAARARAFSPT